MATKTETAISALISRVDITEVRVEVLVDQTANLQQLEKQVAVIEHRLADLTKSQDVWGNRGWVIFMVGVSGAVTLLSAAVGGLLTFYLNAKK